MPLKKLAYTARTTRFFPFRDMIKVFLSWIALCVLGVSVGVAQTISGKVHNTAGEPISNAQILLKDSVSAFQFKEFFFATNGAYSFQPKQAYPNLVVEINAMGYKKAHFVVAPYQHTQTYTHDFVLEIETESLGEVVVTASKRYEQREDTISYNVSAYRDGTEKKIEDIIKKLPGIEVNDRTGQIKYNGKPVETVNLDGDNLFDKSYAIGTRNIDVDMVEQVQALENYSENPLLKGVESGEKVALNLVLKKTGIKFSGSAEVGLGAFASDRLQRATDFSSNVLGITQKFKGFATLSHNNIGTNNTPYDYAGYSVADEVSQNPAMYAPHYIPDTYFSVGIDAKRNNFNNTLFNSVNMLFKPSKRLSVKVNLLYLHDKITSEQFSQNDFSFNNEVFSTSDRLSIRKTPNRYIGKLELKYTLSSKSMIEYHGSYDVENIRTSTEVLQNNTNLYSTRLQSDARLLRQALIYTYRLSKNKAIQLTATHILHKTPQEYLFLPAIYEAQTYSANNQTSAFEKNYTEIKAQLLGKIEKEGENGRVIMPNRDKNKYDLSVVAIRQVSNFNTDLWGDLAQGAQAIPSFRNRGLYKRYTAYANTGYKWVLGRWVIQPSAKASVMQQGVQDFVTAQDYAITQFIFEPMLNLR
ncbi:MAG: hypothetical protein EAZ95_13430, partial [Bacteroidetes bacterium]